jgi:EAL domain-containing protein (putative c-di-GMP-specific phosphodiesterase class I)
VPDESAPSLGQIGHEEYCILLPGLPQPHLAFKVAQRLQETLEAPLALEGGSAQAQVAIGIALHPADARDARALLDHARATQRTVQRDTGAGVRFFQPALNAAAVQRLTLEAALRKAVQKGELTVHYQPKVRIADGKIVGAEALVRWKHPELGQVSPAQFIPIAEETGLIQPIGEFVLAEACRQNLQWQREGLSPIRMAVNLSPIQLHEPQLLDVLRQVLARTGLAPEWLELEITESILLQDADATIERLESLRDFGIHLSIDDFGTGYSSLAYLRRFPIETLKIDQAFIRELTTSPDDAAITTSIILMGKSLKLNVVAEGVETRSQLALLQVLECDEAQGYLFGKPTDAAGLRQVLERGVDPALIPPKR